MRVQCGKFTVLAVRLEVPDRICDSDSAGSRIQPGSELRDGGGGDRIRTCDALTDILVFKTSAFNRSATPPPGCQPNSGETARRLSLAVISADLYRCPAPFLPAPAIDLKQPVAGYYWAGTGCLEKSV